MNQIFKLTLLSIILLTANNIFAQNKGNLSKADYENKLYTAVTIQSEDGIKVQLNLVSVEKGHNDGKSEIFSLIFEGTENLELADNTYLLTFNSGEKVNLFLTATKKEIDQSYFQAVVE